MASEQVSDKQVIPVKPTPQGLASDSKEEEVVMEDKLTEEGAISTTVYIKHPLQHKWALWFFKNDKSKTWAANLRLITKFDTVEDFWALYNHIQAASRLQSGCDYSLFKDGIEPMWEDERNKRGGRWLLNLQKHNRNHDLDRFWLETLLCLIGEAFGEESDEVNGAVVNIRNKGDKIAIWTADSTRGDETCKIGRLFKERLNLAPKHILGFQAHADTISKTGSTAKNLYST
ncbi:eukaryotic translation initiation factor 4E-like [Saccoglossus kowalevskii]|uniref:Eukaryotic translation initiation factor 4E-1A-like n=1 Tax=Saccoglossus kowalevskii TaxID=10224 RepID=A0ABM0GTP1_SACKO|nr:PREDICTED: eukaryotic translation initiation factor 4E-1A-like [Saccoglossus kowalevskii]